MKEAGAGSPHLQENERDQAAQHSAPHALVIHEVVREEGEQELRKRPSAVAWSGLSAGLSMGFSFLCLATITSLLPATPASQLISSVGYTIGFVFAILGRQELFTESTLTAILPLLVRRDRATLIAVLRFWIVVLTANLAGTALFAALLTQDGLVSDAVAKAMVEISEHHVRGEFGITALKAVLSGWIIALMAWLLPSAKSARLFVIMLMTYVVALCGLPHVVAGSVEAAYALFTGHASVREFLIGFLLPTLLGNIVGGVALVALLNHAPLAEDFKNGRAKDHEAKSDDDSTAEDRSAGKAGRERLVELE